ncbi:DUF2946 domain-containing protein [Marinomonas algarum]|uniref:DUF2946 domain-containing protein n=1 Tax=Marinomonas algarum TaxID=2883105 RepID=A0A9X1IQB2_9GAMM|nr:DUF2946 domain-containing protein [Marinomonas algarum]MCB5162181.1 DUF2946 domain-containing protein [Marinomonas algarum]
MPNIIRIKPAIIAYICLFAILMLTLGPLVAQIKTPTMSPLLMHTMPSAAQMVSSHHHDSSHEDHHAGMSMHHAGMDGMAWDERCGYCELNHNFPLVINHLPIIKEVSSSLSQRSKQWVRAAFRSDTLFLLALKRAPPRHLT